jgi:hypothetical protein
MATCTSCKQTIADGSTFCNNCGAPVGAVTPAAPKPPAHAPLGVVFTKFCASCGSGLVSAAVICPSCGAAQKGFNTSGGKSKTTAVLLAVFLSAWTWVYTWKANAKKFWIALGLWVVQIIIVIIGAQQAVSKLTCNQTGACAYHTGTSAGIILFAYLISFGIWIWAIVDASTKSQQYYSNL